MQVSNNSFIGNKLFNNDVKCESLRRTDGRTTDDRRTDGWTTGKSSLTSVFVKTLSSQMSNFPDVYVYIFWSIVKFS